MIEQYIFFLVKNNKIYCMKKRRIIIIMASLAVFLVTTFASCAKNPNKKLQEINTKGPYDAIIVPGVPYADADWSKILMARIYWSYYLYSNGYTKNIIYSGSAVYTPYVESEIMAMYGAKMGIPEEHIFTESRAEHSVENVYYSYQLAKEKGFHKVALATDPFQSKWMEGPSKRMKVDIDFIPFSAELIDTLQVKDYKINADKAYIKNFVALDQRKNFFQRLRGTLGGNLDY